MPRTRLFRGRADRVIGWARVILAAGSTAAVSLNPALSGRTAGLTFGILGFYCALAAISLPVGRRLHHARWYGLALHGADLAVCTAVMSLTEGPTSPFFVLFNFPVLAAALKWRWKGALWTSAAVLALFIAMGLTFSLWLPVDFQGDLFVVRCAQLLAVGLLLVYFGLHRERFFEELARLTAWPAILPDRHQDNDPLPVRSVLAHVATVFAAPRALLLWSDPEEPWIYVREWRDGQYRRERLPPDLWEQVIANPLADRLCLFETSSETMFLDAAGNLQHAPIAAVDPALRRHFEIASGIAVPVRGESIQGRLFVLDKRDLSADDLGIAAVLAARIDGAIAHAAALDLWHRTAAAEERLRVARDLHDGILQVLAGTDLKLQALRMAAGREIADQIASLQRWLVHEQRELRGFIRRLEPGATTDAAEGLDLAADLGSLAERLQQQWSMEVEVSVAPSGARLPAALCFDLHQIVRESAANAARHGKASKLWIAIAIDNEQLLLDIEDDGCGFPFKRHYSGEECMEAAIGPQSLAWRVRRLSGTLSAGSGRHGAHISITLPLGAQPARDAA
jgi:signal transduction histidine kinase